MCVCVCVASVEEEDDEAEEDRCVSDIRVSRRRFFWREVTQKKTQSGESTQKKEEGKEGRGRSSIVFPARHSGESCCDLFAHSPHVIVSCMF